jgi:predicted DNA-binding transcriptional regulator AlpA
MDIPTVEVKRKIRRQPPMERRESSLLTTFDLAAFLRVSPWTVRGWRKRGRGPRFFRLSDRTVRYSLSHVKAFLEGRSCRPRARRK